MALHREGITHSIEAWAGDTLAGGLYGVYVNNTFSGESMFHLRPDASKAALASLVQMLNRAGIKWIDTQMLTPVVAALGGELVSKKDYLMLLKQNRNSAHIPWSHIQNSL